MLKWNKQSLDAAFLNLMDENIPDEDEICPKCGSTLAPVTMTASGRKIQRCSAGTWNPKTRKTDGCDYVKWYPFEPQVLEGETCPKCGSPLVFAITKFGKRMKKCSTGGWDSQARKATGCDYIEWINGTTQALDEACPTCGSPLVLYTTAAGKKMKKCSTAGWDKAARTATGCPYIEWLK